MTDMADPGDELARAVARGDLARVSAILRDDPGRLRDTTGGRHLLSVAAQHGQTVVARLLLERGADPAWPDADAPRGGALHHAARTRNRPLVELLLANGADPNGHVEASGNAVFAAAGDPELRALLEEHGGTLDPYDLVWLDEDDEVMRLVMASPASADAGCGGVYAAVVTRGKRHLLVRLLDAGVRVPPRPGGCRSYLLEEPDMLRQLLARAGLDPDYTDEDGSTLLHDLCRGRGPGDAQRRVECAAILLDAGASLAPRDAQGLTPLACAVRRGDTALVEFLAARGAG